MRRIREFEVFLHRIQRRHLPAFDAVERELQAGQHIADAGGLGEVAGLQQAGKGGGA